MIYFLITKDERFIKIGWTERSVIERLADLDQAHPEPLQLIAWMSGDRYVESRLLKRFEASRVRGEWFHFDTSIREWIETEQIAVPATTISFFAWLMRHCCCGCNDDPLGDFARDVAADLNFPRELRTFAELLDHLRRAGTHAHEAAESAWTQYLVDTQPPSLKYPSKKRKTPRKG